MADQEDLFRGPPFLVVGDTLANVSHAAHPEDWVEVECGKREAYGCGENGQRIVQGLNLYIRAGPKDDPEFGTGMRIGATPDVLNLVGEEIDEKMAEICGRQIQLCAIVHSVDGGVMVLHISLVARHMGTDFRSYCLVYDSASTSKGLFLLPERPHGCLPLCPSSPVKLGQDKFSVVLLVQRLAPDSSTYPVLCLWSPPPATSSIKSLNEEECAWIDKGRILRLEADAAIGGFVPTHVFSYKGNAVWGDLGKGILYCDCRDLNLGPAPVDFKLNLLLPLECRAPAFDFDQPPFPVYRNMGCVGDSIWFVIIKPPPSSEQQDPAGETVVKVWTLDRLSEEEEWKPHAAFKMQAIWEGAHSLPKTVPRFPIIRHKDDGILYMLLPENPDRGGCQYVYLLGIDLSSSFEPRLLTTRCLILPFLHRPFVLDPDFFGLRHMLFEE